jgi:hypothetical protein
VIVCVDSSTCAIPARSTDRRGNVPRRIERT